MIPIDWEELAWEHNFKGDDKEMLRCLNHDQQLSLREIEAVLKVNYSSIRKRMKHHSVELIIHHKEPIQGRFPRVPYERRK